MNSYYEKILATGDVKCIDEEIPFEIPATWNWARLSNITSILGDGIHGTPEYDATGTVYFINGNNLSNGSIEIKADTKKVSEQEAEKHKRLLNSTTVLVSINGTLGNVAFYNGENVILGKSACYFNLMGNIDKQYIKHILETEYFTEYAKNVATGSTIKNVPLAGMRNFLIPVPPITEQHRIILGMVRLAHSIVRYNDAQTKLDLLNNVLNEKLKKSVLQEAIQGKLVPQLAEEGTAQELLEQIKAEKEKLVKEGKLKKSALNNTVIFRGDDNKYYEQIGCEVTEIELPFDFPSTWSIARLNAVCQLSDGLKTVGKQCLLDAKYLRGKSSETIAEQGKLVYKGDNIMLVDGENSGEVFIVPQDGYMGSTFKLLWISSSMYEPYVLAFLQFYKETLRNSKKGAAIPHLNKELFYGLIIGIPPLQEQRRVVQKIEQSSKLLK
ncbi:restriction endonuclease subunit S [Bacteroides ovatus]|uniref:restriction endonuclease subunit S n=1 Tax=Bacteroides ovatus TaxID=28116 RepID=UPI0021CF0DAE|nr:restriction endonuclease subunit S [Bacteroides ovatus]